MLRVPEYTAPLGVSPAAMQQRIIRMLLEDMARFMQDHAHDLHESTTQTVFHYRFSLPLKEAHQRLHSLMSCPA